MRAVNICTYIICDASGFIVEKKKGVGKIWPEFSGQRVGVISARGADHEFPSRQWGAFRGDFLLEEMVSF